MGKEQIFVIGGILGSIILIVIGAVFYNNMQFGDPAKAISNGKFIHWHADITASVCGQERETPRSAPGGTLGQHGGIHTHDDGRIHIEGVFKSEADVALRKWLSAVSFPYSEQGIYEKSDGSPCGSNEATASAQATGSATGSRLKGFVNDKEVANILDYSMRDGDKIRLVYE